MRGSRTRRFPGAGAAFIAAAMAVARLSSASGEEVRPAPASSILETWLDIAEQGRIFDDIASLRRFYEQRSDELAWSGAPEAESHAARAFDALARADEDGLDPDAYRIALVPATSLSPDSSAESDLRLTAAFLRYMRDRRVGHIAPRILDSLIELPRNNFDAVAELSEALDGGDLDGLIGNLAPPHAGYANLKRQLARHRQLEAQGGWTPIAAGPEIDLSEDADPRMAQLGERIVREYSDLAPLAADGDMGALVRGYQARNGLDPDGRVGPRTLAMLNIPVSARIEQIIANMERWRWMPRSFEPRFVSVNVADASLELVDNARVAVASRIIVGQPQTPTPMFRAEIVGITVNPPWNVPLSIARNEILPRLRSDRMYLADRNMILVNGAEDDPHGLTVDWNAISRDAFPYQIRQLPGPDNALGSIKFELPNRFSVYLHDTPARSLFARPERYFSHGCIRVDAVRSVAAFILEHNSRFDAAAIDEAIANGQTTLLELDDPLPVYVLYWTAVANADGSFGFRRDIYGRDAVLISALKSPVAPATLVSAELGCPLPG